jgi:pilus assembly protein CpaB
MLVVKAVPSDLALVGAFDKTDDVVGQTTQVALLTGEQVVPAKVASAGTAITQYGANAPLSIVTPEGRRAVSIAVSDVAAAGGLVRPGDHIDVMMTVSGGSNDQGQNLAASSCFVLQDVQVLAVGTAVTQTTSDTDANGIAAAGAVPGASTMTLAVTPTEAGSLASAQVNVTGGSVGNPLWVALRNFSDHTPLADVPFCNLGNTAQ